MPRQRSSALKTNQLFKELAQLELESESSLSSGFESQYESPSVDFDADHQMQNECTLVLPDEHVINSTSHDSMNASHGSIRPSEGSEFRPSDESNVFSSDESEPQLNIATSQRHHVGEMNVKCEDCTALMFLEEKTTNSSIIKPKFTLCCNNGLISMEPLLTPPCLLTLLRNDDFRTAIRQINTLFAFTSSTAKYDKFLASQREGISVYKVHGAIHHRIPETLLPSCVDQAALAQLYIYDPETANDLRMRNVNSNLRPYMDQIQDMLTNVGNRHIGKIRNKEFLESPEATTYELKIVPKKRRPIAGQAQRTYDLPESTNLAALIPHESGWEREIVVKSRDPTTNQLKFNLINSFSSVFESLHFPLLFPRGEHGWWPQRPTGGTRKIKRGFMTDREYALYRLMARPGDGEHILLAGRLLQELIVTLAARMEERRLKWVRFNQKTLRAETYKCATQMLSANDQPEGDRIILPSTFKGSKRAMQRLYQNAMAVVRTHGKPSFFLTVTCNPKWPEIMRELDKVGLKKPEDRPDLIDRVFNLKLKEISKDIMQRHVLGKMKAMMYSVEFQKRGNPHAHFLLILENPIQSPTVVDEHIKAEFPDPETEPDLFASVKRHMIHGPCKTRACFKGNDVPCSKGFPKAFQTETVIAEQKYPLYQRRDDGKVYNILRNRTVIQVTNQNIVAYSPFFLKKFDCHVNLEFVSSVKSVKYCYKYVCKGPDQLSAEISHDEVKNYVDARYLTAQEAFWKLAGFTMHYNSVSVSLLPVHLENEQRIYFDEGASREEVQATIQKSTTKLIGFFELCSRNEFAKTLTYSEIPAHFTWGKRNGALVNAWWPKKKITKAATGRLPLILPNVGEPYYLRQLLGHVKGPTSFAHLRTVEGVEFDTNREACFALNIVQDDGLFEKALGEAIMTMTSGQQLRAFFVLLLLNCEVISPRSLFLNNYEKLGEDLNVDEEVLEIAVLYRIQPFIREKGSTLSQMFITTLSDEEVIRRGLEINEINFTSVVHDVVDVNLLNEEQKSFIDQVLRHRKKLTMLDAPGGTGKTFTLKALMQEYDGKIVCVASTGIAALCLPDATTAHSKLNIPIKVNSTTMCRRFTKRTKLGKKMMHAQLLVWVEITAVSKYVLDTVDRSLREVRDCDEPFGGMQVVFSGDFRQTIAILKLASPTQLILNSVKFAKCWSRVESRHLIKNMRVQSDCNGKDWAQFILDVGDDIAETDEKGLITLPTYITLKTTPSDLIDFVFGDFTLSGKEAILAPRNDMCAVINDLCLQRLQVNAEDEKEFFSFDEILEKEGSLTQFISSEYLNMIEVSGLPPHKLKLKKGALIMCLRNLSPSQGLLNGTRLIVTSLYNHRIEAKIITEGKCFGKTVNLPRIKLNSTEVDLPFTLQRTQFPVRLCYAMTINKSQCQTLNKVGLYLTPENQCFAHGQLYVALSRVTNPCGLAVFGSRKMVNVVHERILHL